ncbi:MAG: 50S ribosomal protein L10 [Planctomycetes bacterium]|nr:50S ribosomal protein L10 [Planctomycetota bacterium]
MSKVIKQMQMDALKDSFKGVRDLVMLNVVGLDAIAENKIRLDLRKKGIRLQMVKNSLAQRVFDGMGLSIKSVWEGSTTVAWGAASVAELSKEIEGVVKKHDKKIKVKTAVADGQEVPFATALKMPTRPEALGRVVMLAMAPARRVAGQIVGPASQVCGQIKGIKDMKKDEAPAAETPAAPPPA